MSAEVPRYPPLLGPGPRFDPPQWRVVETPDSIAIAPLPPPRYWTFFFVALALVGASAAAIFIRPWTSETTSFAGLAVLIWIANYAIFGSVWGVLKKNFDAGDYLRIERSDVTRFNLQRLKRAGTADAVDCFHVVAGWPGVESLSDSDPGTSELHIRLKTGEELLIVDACGMNALDEPAQRIAAFSGVPLQISKQAVEFNFHGQPKAQSSLSKPSID